ncbi:MAG: hypothetical protein KC636_19185, partial [Myxococcales bacterium]|nr:hypothetical protein [Myxococcales bacterium]
MRRPALLLALALAAGCSDAPVDTTAGTTAASTGATDEPATTGDDGTSDASTTGDATTVDPTDTTDAETTDGPGCQGPPPPCVNPVCEDSSWSCPCALAPEAGFAELEPIDFVLGEGDEATALRSSPARLFYSFHPASDDPCGKPLILLFNGGPGIGSELLLTSGTTATLLAESGALVENPSPWTALGNLLFVDARVAGLSYSLMDDPSDSAARAAEFSLANFNVYLDAADFARALLRFLADHEPLTRNQVMIVGESYGGTRATLLLHLLLFHAQYRDGARRYQDPALVDEIEAHLAGVFREEDTFPPDRVAAQFSHAALIQPLVAGEPQLLQSGVLLEADGSPIWALAAEVGETFVPCSELGPNCSPYLNVLGFVEQDAGRSRYDLDAPATWLSSYLNRTRV